MTVQSIRLFGDPVLVTPANPVTDFDKELRNLVSDLTQTMQAAPGAGLAAPQIGVPLRVFVWDIDDELGHLVNPTLARCLQHETDHLNGVLFIDRMNSEQRKIAMKEIRESDWFGLANQNGFAPKIKISPHNTHGQGL